MLKLFRRYTKIIIWFVVGSFMLWGGYSVTALKKEGRYAGEVFGKPISFKEYNQFARATQLFMPSEKPVDDAELLRDYTWQNIIYAHEAALKGVKVPDEEVREEIVKILKQQGLTNPTTEQYKGWLSRSLQISTREFEEGLREFVRIQKLLRSEIIKTIPEGSEKLTDPKAKEDASEKQKIAFMTWTNDVNKRAGLKDYLALPKPQPEEPAPAATPTK
ncbi:MAG: SurA N-terminal domain-containing protein [Candidatus Omnitrophota bacterium]